MQTETALARVVTVSAVPDIGGLPDDALLTSRQVEVLSGYTDQALKKWRREGRGPRFVTVEGRPRYPVGTTRAWLRGQAAA